MNSLKSTFDALTMRFGWPSGQKIDLKFSDLSNLPQDLVYLPMAESIEHKNYWSSFKHPYCTWEVIFDLERTTVEQFVWWAGEALKVLFDTGIYKVYSIPDTGYSSPKADPLLLAEFISNRVVREGVIDLLYFSKLSFAGNPLCANTTTLSYFDKSGAIITEECSDLATLQYKTQPWLHESRNHIYHRMPVVIEGAIFAPERHNYPTENVGYNPKRVYLRLKTHTDIWLPAVLGWNEPSFDGDQRYLNMEISALNGIRLNHAIHRLSETTRAIGGTWRIDEDVVNITSDFDEAGAILKMH